MQVCGCILYRWCVCICSVLSTSVITCISRTIPAFQIASHKAHPFLCHPLNLLYSGAIFSYMCQTWNTAAIVTAHDRFQLLISHRSLSCGLSDWVQITAPAIWSLETKGSQNTSKQGKAKTARQKGLKKTYFLIPLKSASGPVQPLVAIKEPWWQGVSPSPQKAAVQVPYGIL